MYRKLTLLILIFVCHFLFSNEMDNAYQLALLTGEPSANIDNAVNAITGDYFISESEFFVQGYEPIDLHPLYISKNGKDYWTNFQHLIIELIPAFKTVFTYDPNGVCLEYSTIKFPETKKVDSKDKKKEEKKQKNENTFVKLILREGSFKEGLTNCANSEISGRLNLKNNEVLMNLNQNKITINCANGTIRHYEKFKIIPLLKSKNAGMKLEVNSYEFRLIEEILPNQNKIIYTYENETLKQIKTTNSNGTKIYSSLNAQFPTNQMILTSSDNKKLICNSKLYEKHYLRSSCQFPEKPFESYEYTTPENSKSCIYQRNKPQNRNYQIEYYRIGTHTVNNKTIQIKDETDPIWMRVKSIKTRSGLNGELIDTYKFIYNLSKDPKNGFTEVYDVNNVKTIYRFSNLRLDAIERYDENNNLKNKEILSWGKGQNATKDVTFLLSKTFLDSKDNVVSHKEFTYDDKGNITKESFFGNLSGNSKEILTNSSSFEEKIKKVKESLEVFSKYKKYSQDNRNLLISEENDNHLKIEYFYIPNTDLVKSKIISYKNQIKIRNFYEYNEDYVLIKEIVDDGTSYDSNDISNITQRQIKIITPKKENPFINMPEIIEEKFIDLIDNTEKLLKKTILTYSNFGKVIKEDVYNSKNIYEYSIKRTYDEKGLLLEEINPQGYVTTYNKYDENFNLLSKNDPNGKKTNFEYDLLNRLIKKEEISTDDINHTFTYKYDLASNIVAQTDYLNNITNFKYDSSNNLIETIKPTTSSGIAIVNTKFDDLSRPIETKDPKGNITKTFYNAFNLPILINHPDNTNEKFIYNLDGSLKKYIDQEGNSTTYEYDFLQRELKKTINSPYNNKNVTEEKTYSSFNQTSFKDFEGNLTTYKYDSAGRKISQNIANETLGFIYDNLSRLSTTVVIDDQNSLYNIQVKDYLNRIVEERKEDKDNIIYFKINYEYDSQNNKIKIIRYINNNPCIEKFKYDSFNRLILHEDAEGNIDTTSYIEENSHLLVKHTDPVKLQTLQTFDALNRPISEEKIFNNTLCSKEEFFYDLSNNLISQKSKVISQENQNNKIVEIKKEYDEMNRLKTLIEAFNSPNQKQTSYSYTKKGLISQILKPNKIVLSYEYDFLNNNTRLFSSNNSTYQPIDYQFTYNNLGVITEVKDNLTNKIIKREIDHKGRILKETLTNNLSIENFYNKKGDKIKVILPDKSSIDYIHNPLFLKKIIRKNSNEEELYKHEFSCYDIDGNCLEQLLIDQSQLLKDFDKMGRNTQIKTSFFTQKIDSFNSDGTINQMTFSTIPGSDTSTFKYDPLKQLINENGLITKKYSFDSHNNRLKKDDINYEVNDLNEIIKTNQDEIQYDENGNPLVKHSTNGDIFYKYDALDRLIYIEKPSYYKLEFEYDAFHRRTSKKYFKYYNYYFSSGYDLKSFNNYLYDDQNEIASLDEQNNFKELRILSNTSHAEIGSSIAFEIEGIIYLPIHDIQGNVSCLVSPDHNVETYRYSAFGEEKIYFNKSFISYSYFNNSWRFSSKRKDESDLIYYGRRYYDPEFGRWLTTDPQGFIDGINLYAFVLNDPLIKVDLYGLYTNQYTFNYLEKDYYSKYIRDKSQILPILGNPNSINKAYVINGQDNTKQEAFDNAYCMYNNIKNVTNNMGVIPLYASTRGLPEDTIRTYFQKKEFYKPSRIEMIQNELIMHANYLIQNNIDTKSFIVSFSRGSLDLYYALQNMTSKQKDNFIIFNLGFYKAISKEDGFIVRNIRSSRDPIPAFFCSFECCNLEGNRYQGYKKTDKFNIIRIPNKSGKIIDHTFKSKTYQEALIDEFDDLYPKYGK